MTFDRIYKKALKHVVANGVWQDNKRTGSRVLSTHGYSFRWDMKNWPITLVRPMYVKTMSAELVWMLSGEKSIKWINQYTSIWKEFADENQRIDTAYGFRWKWAYGYDQIKNIVNKLREDPTSRQQVLLSWDAKVDNVIPAANIPCPYTAVFNIIAGELNCHLTLRSNDAYLGLPYDVGMYTLLSNALASELNVKVGKLFYSIAHMHIYENQLEAVHYVIDKDLLGEVFPIYLPTWSIRRIQNNQEEYVEAAIKAISNLDYKPGKGPDKVKVVL